MWFSAFYFLNSMRAVATIMTFLNKCALVDSSPPSCAFSFPHGSLSSLLSSSVSHVDFSYMFFTYVFLLKNIDWVSSLILFYICVCVCVHACLSHKCMCVNVALLEVRRQLEKVGLSFLHTGPRSLLTQVIGLGSKRLYLLTHLGTLSQPLICSYLPFPFPLCVQAHALSPVHVCVEVSGRYLIFLCSTLISLIQGLPLNPELISWFDWLPKGTWFTGFLSSPPHRLGFHVWVLSWC